MSVTSQPSPCPHCGRSDRLQSAVRKTEQPSTTGPLGIVTGPSTRDLEKPIKVTASDITRELQFHVKLGGFRAFRIRLWLARRVILLAGFVAGFGIEFDAGDENVDEDVDRLQLAVGRALEQIDEARAILADGTEYERLHIDAILSNGADHLRTMLVLRGERVFNPTWYWGLDSWD